MYRLYDDFHIWRCCSQPRPPSPTKRPTLRRSRHSSKIMQHGLRHQDPFAGGAPCQGGSRCEGGAEAVVAKPVHSVAVASQYRTLDRANARPTRDRGRCRRSRRRRMPAPAGCGRHRAATASSGTHVEQCVQSWHRSGAERLLCRVVARHAEADDPRCRTGRRKQDFHLRRLSHSASPKFSFRGEYRPVSLRLLRFLDAGRQFSLGRRGLYSDEGPALRVCHHKSGPLFFPVSVI